MTGFAAVPLFEGLLGVPAAEDVLRFLPPLTVERGHVDEAMTMLEAAIVKLET